MKGPGPNAHSDRTLPTYFTPSYGPPMAIVGVEVSLGTARRHLVETLKRTLIVVPVFVPATATIIPTAMALGLVR